MDVRIGVTYTAKELTIELEPDTDVAALRTKVDGAIGGKDDVLWLTDKRGRQVGVPTERVAYVEIGSPDQDRRIGFGA